MPDVDDLPTDDALRFGRFRVVLRSFEDFALDVGLLLNPMKYLRALVGGLVSGESCSTSRMGWIHAQFAKMTNEAYLHIFSRHKSKAQLKKENMKFTFSHT